MTNLSKEDILKNVSIQTPLTSTVRETNTIEVNGVHQLSGCSHSSKHFILCSTNERNSYGFETTWGWV